VGGGDRAPRLACCVPRVVVLGPNVILRCFEKNSSNQSKKASLSSCERFDQSSAFVCTSGSLLEASETGVAKSGRVDRTTGGGGPAGKSVLATGATLLGGGAGGASPELLREGSAGGIEDGLRVGNGGAGPGEGEEDAARFVATELEAALPVRLGGGPNDGSSGFVRWLTRDRGGGGGGGGAPLYGSQFVFFIETLIIIKGVQ